MSFHPRDPRVNEAKAVQYPSGGTCAACGAIAGSSVVIYACCTWVECGRGAGIRRRVTYRCGDCAEKWVARQADLGKNTAWFYGEE